MSDDAIDPEYLNEDPASEVRKAEELRQAATRSWAAMDNRARVLKAL